MTRGAPLSTLDDDTSLTGTDIDVGVRIGWVARMARLAPESGGLTLERMSRLTGVSTATLHRLETGRLRDGSLLDAYEAALARPVGSLRAPVDIACRAFASAPPDRNPSGAVGSVRELSVLTATVSTGTADGGTWLRWARTLAGPSALGMPEDLARELIATLVGELCRSVGHAHPARYEALALLRGSAYGYLVADVARDWVSHPDVQVLYDLCSAVGELATSDAVAWLLELVDDDRDAVVVGGALGLENMGQVSRAPEDFWRPLVGPLTERFNASAPGSTQWEWLSHLVRLVPAIVHAAAPVRVTQPLAPAAKIENWSRTRLNHHWSDCQARAHATTARLGLPDQPVLARMLFDIAVSPHESLAVAGNLLLGSVPYLARPVASHVADLASSSPDPVLRARAGRRLPGALHGWSSPLVDRWLAEDDAELRDRSLYAAGASGAHVDDSVLRRAVDGGSVRAALYAAGMTGHPLLTEWGDERHRDPVVRGAARWWLGSGTRVVDPGQAPGTS